MKKIFYLGYYDTYKNRHEKRVYFAVGANKMSYIVSVMEKAGYTVELVSMSSTRGTNKFDGRTEKIGKNSNLVLFKTLPMGNKIKYINSVLYSRCQLIKHIVKNVKKNDTLVVYHSVGYADVVRILRKLLKFNLVLEVEEIYSDVNNSEKGRKKEEKIFEVADSYIFSTELLNEKINRNNKPYCISYGTYQVEEDRNCKFDDGKIHAIYAGTFNPHKGGLNGALSAVPYLGSQYHVHILGKASDEFNKNLYKNIDKISQQTQCTVTYDGFLRGEDYIRFLQSCHIGLSTQDPSKKFNDTSFPSKILSYLSNGLRVVSIRIPVVEKAEISPLIYFYDENSGEEIAKTISSVDVDSPYDSRLVIQQLDDNLANELKKIL